MIDLQKLNIKEFWSLMVNNFCGKEWSDDFLRQIATGDRAKEMFDTSVFLLVKNLDTVGTELNYLPTYFGLDEWYETEYMYSNILKYMKFSKQLCKLDHSIKLIEKRRDFLKEHNLFCKVIQK